MRNKKVIAGLVAAMTLVSTTSAIVSAAGDFTVSISNTKAEAGKEFSLTLDMADIPSTGINGCDFGIAFDSSLVTVDSVTLGALAKDVSSLEGDLPDPFECNIEDDVISLMYAIGTTDSSYYLNGSGTFLNITGTVKKDAAVGSKAEFEVVPVDRAAKPGSADTNATAVFGYMGEDETATIYTPVFEAGWVEVTGEVPTEPSSEATDPTEPSSEDPTQPSTEETEPSTGNIADGTNYGDVNVDGTVDVADVVALNMYLLNPSGNALEAEGVANADVVRDNKIDSTDGTLLMSFTAMSVEKSELGK